MIYELRTYTLQPGTQAQYLKNSAEVGRKIRGDKYGKFEGGWSTEFGTLNQYVHLWSFENLDANFAVFMKTKLGAGETRCPSLRPIWPGADWMERECFDMFGVRFEGHPDLRRILLPQDWEGHPLLKSYAVDTPHPPYR